MLAAVGNKAGLFPVDLTLQHFKNCLPRLSYRKDNDDSGIFPSGSSEGTGTYKWTKDEKRIKVENVFFEPFI